MRNFTVPLAAGVPSRFEVPGAYFRLMTGQGVNVRLYQPRGGTYEARTVDAGYWAKPEAGMVAVELDSANTQTVRFFVSDGDGGYDRVSGSVDADIVGDTFGGSVTVTVGTVDVALAVANIARRKLMIRSREDNTAVVYIQTGPTVFLTGASFVLYPGDLYVEEDSPCSQFTARVGAGSSAVIVTEAF